jgi:phospholipid transport system substrate-binding protein
MSRSIALALRLATTLTLPLAVALVAPVSAQAAVDDAAAVKIVAFDDSLIQLMKAGHTSGAQSRYKMIAPAVESTFDIPTMARLVTGASWASASAADRAALIAAFRRFTIASYVKNFNGYGGQKIAVNPDVLTRGLDKVVRTEMSGAGPDVVLAYRMRQTSGSWRAIDVLFNGSISQLTLQRSDFAATVAQGGAKALADELDAKADRLLK